MSVLRNRLSVPLSLGAIVLLGVLALTVPAGSVAGLDTQTVTTPPQAPESPKAPNPAKGPGARYRPVGCVEHSGAVAHFNGPPRGVVRAHGPPRKVVALTFDDGPSSLTLQFVRMLAAHHVPATFFLLGEQLSGRYRAVLREELRDGDALGDHSWSHPDLAVSGDVYSQLRNTKWAIRGLSGYTPCVFRPPYGAYDQSVLRAARALGLATIVWSVDPTDWALPGTGAIEERVLSQVTPGSIVLSHDGGGPRGETLAAYPHIIEALRRRGYGFATVPELLGYRTIYRTCRRQCDESAIQGTPPPGSIVEGATKARPLSRRRSRQERGAPGRSAGDDHQVADREQPEDPFGRGDRQLDTAV